jgi:dipeptide/tripeptide permease
VAAGSWFAEESGFTLAFAMSAVGVGAAFLFALAIPARRDRGAVGAPVPEPG